tara:strand:- start:520 stop:648 length:129 start_codon:yes stop_codon:yes gene_type:complete
MLLSLQYSFRSDYLVAIVIATAVISATAIATAVIGVAIIVAV